MEEGEICIHPHGGREKFAYTHMGGGRNLHTHMGGGGEICIHPHGGREKFLHTPTWGEGEIFAYINKKEWSFIYMYLTVHQMCVLRNKIYFTWNRLCYNYWSLHVFHIICAIRHVYTLYIMYMYNVHHTQCTCILCMYMYMNLLTFGALINMPGLTQSISLAVSDCGRTSSSQLLSPARF